MKHIVLIGMMGCGKTTVGGLLSKALGREQADTDALIEEREGRSISEIFAADGEEYFRALELALAKELAGQEGLILSCGGGLPLRGEAMDALRASGTVFWLDRDPAVTYDSLDTASRPLAQQGREAFLARYAQRAPIYRAAAHHVVTDFSSPEATVNAILEVLK